MENIWDFVVEYYPNYYSSSEITLNDDLLKLKEKEFDEDSGPWKLLHSRFNGDINHPEIDKLYYLCLSDIFSGAIENFINIQNKNNENNMS